jgi:predicted lipid-binding transport protein (Tim44 family)
VLVFAVLGLFFRVFAALLIGVGGLLVAGLGLGFALAGGLALFALGFAMLHLLLPVLLIVGLIWLIKRASQPTPPALPAAHP